MNFTDDGCAHHLSIGLAIREFDQNLLSNFNFRCPDALKFNVLTSGLEEVRAILQFQLLHKHCLIVACRANQLLIDTCERAFSELTLVGSHKICVPNPVIPYSKVLSRNFDMVHMPAVKSCTNDFKQNLSSVVQPLLYNIFNKKNQQRTTLAKEFSAFQTQVQNEYPHHEPTVIRIMRSFKVRLLTRYVQNIGLEVYLDA